MGLLQVSQAHGWRIRLIERDPGPDSEGERILVLVPGARPPSTREEPQEHPQDLRRVVRHERSSLPQVLRVPGNPRVQDDLLGGWVVCSCPLPTSRGLSGWVKKGQDRRPWLPASSGGRSPGMKITSPMIAVPPAGFGRPHRSAQGFRTSLPSSPQTPSPRSGDDSSRPRRDRARRLGLHPGPRPKGIGSRVIEARQFGRSVDGTIGASL